ncbi:MAG: exosortase B [Pseudomonadota bacterium]|nr:exosortase B [Pseudomonadota bacterium]
MDQYLDKQRYLLWGSILLGLFLLYLPVYIELFNKVWVTDEQSHGPIVLAIILFLFYKKLPNLTAGEASLISKVAGWSLLSIGLVLYVLGHSQSILEFSSLSQFFIITGILLVFYGTSAVKNLWFPVLFLLFLVPIPGSILTAVTLPMKIAVSYVAEIILYSFDFPIARTGVILQIGQYKLLVADACAGIHTVISLEAMGLLYLYLIKSDSLIRNVTLAILILPISFIANVIRVIVLVLVTYYYGDEVGQGFIHDFAGFLLFTVALIIIIVTDSVLRWLSTQIQKNKRSQADE